MKIKVTFFDFESTSENPNTAEILTGFFKTLIINFKDGTYELNETLSITSKPEKYLQESFEFHRITRDEANNFEPKIIAARKICKYLKKHNDGLFCCHSNAFIFGRRGHFDWSLIKISLLGISHDAYYWFSNNLKNAKVISTHTIAKKILCQKNLDLKTLANQYELSFNHHNAEEDTEVMIKIFMRLIEGLKIESTEDLFDLGNLDGIKNWTKNGLLI